MAASSGDRQPAHPPAAGKTQRRSTRRRTTFGCLALLLAVALGVGFYGFVVAPVLDRQGHELQVMRTAFDALPPYPGSTLVHFNATNEWGRQPDVVAGYRYPGPCTDVQHYYAAQAVKGGWSITMPLYVAKTVDPSTDEYETDFQQSISGLRLMLSVACFVREDGSVASDPADIYTVSIQKAP